MPLRQVSQVVNTATEQEEIESIDQLVQRKRPSLPNKALTKKDSAPIYISPRISNENHAI